jgi:uncharacterized protein YndB with AHSA1/START domain
MDQLPTYVLERSFDAPRDLVWRAWTEPDLLARWYGPNAETITHKLELRPGGEWLVEMRWGEAASFQRASYQEVAAPERLVWLHANADKDWNAAANPRMPDWPRVLLTVVTFEESNGQTKLRLTWTPHDASEAEIACFAGALGSMDKGWSVGMEMLRALLAEMRS